MTLHTFVVWFLLFVLCSGGSVICSWCGCGDSTTHECRVWPSLTLWINNTSQHPR